MAGWIALKNGNQLMPEHPYREEELIHGKTMRPRLIREGSVLVLSILGAQKMSADEVNEWIRMARDREI
jgi:hypothetical protein